MVFDFLTALATCESKKEKDSSSSASEIWRYCDTKKVFYHWAQIKINNVSYPEEYAK